MRPFDALLHDPALWSTHRRNVTRALALGIVVSFVPFPVHTVIAAILAIYLRVNIPVAIISSWLANPLTMGPMYYGAYQLGRTLLGQSAATESVEFTLGDLSDQLGVIWAPLLLGCAVLGVTSAWLVYWLVNRLWIRALRRRAERRRIKPRDRA